MGLPVTFGPYELVASLGRGGMAETFLGVRRGLGGFRQEVCIKRVLPALARDAEFVGHFLEEAKLAARLRHGNIAQVLDFGEAEETYYLALQLVDGLDLRGLLATLDERGERLSWPQAVRVASCLTAALDYAHDPSRAPGSVIHRDVTPSNVLISRSGDVYLTDFGIARVLGHDRKTAPSRVWGKLHYLSPEYLERREFGPTSDVYALGVTLFQALSGVRPFRDGVGTELESHERIRRGQHPALAPLCPDAPPALCAIVEQAMALDPRDRFQTAAAMGDALATLRVPPGVARALGDLVGRARESPAMTLRNAASLSASLPEPTAALGLGAATHAPPYPEVRASTPEAQTRTLSAAAPQIDPMEASTHAAEAGRWSSTGAAPVRRHGEAARAALDADPAMDPAPARVPDTRLSLPGHPGGDPARGARGAEPRPLRGALAWALAAVACAFAAAGFVAMFAIAYVLIQTWRHGA